MNMDFTAEIYNEALIMIENLCLQIANKVLNQLRMPSKNRSVTALFDVNLRRKQNSNMQKESVTYKSVDTIMKADEAVNYPTEFLNSLDLPQMPPHVLQLKIACQLSCCEISTSQNFATAAACSKKIDEQCRKTTFLTGPSKDEDVLIPRILMIPTDVPFQLKKLQFLIRLAFTFTINKAQDQFLELCLLDQETYCFSYEQLCVGVF
ncbi:unnamed protein product [Onchocerca ochengi]|uniref:ATP-dependent DNA helicase n=1 Tax=Onchocerca ochengi TaxID=42157 RepID=A0A182E6Y1_ONCOC|nr:unnamed protein product [Onchocerca ochengi]